MGGTTGFVRVLAQLCPTLAVVAGFVVWVRFDGLYVQDPFAY